LLYACQYSEGASDAFFVVLMPSEGPLADLELLDHLELLGSTVKVADMLGFSQSSCSRRYRLISDHLDLGFDRGDDGYSARRNFDVLSSLREAAQKLRVRRLQLRFAQAWHNFKFLLPEDWRFLSVDSMSTAHLLSLLDARLIDLWMGGLYECQPLIATPLGLLQANPLNLGQTLKAMPLFRWKLVLLARRDHPLHGGVAITPDDLAAFPSPALPMGVAPLLNRALQRHGLASSPYGSSHYDPQRWDQAAADGLSLSYAPAFRLHELEMEHGLFPLPYELSIDEVTALVGHRDVISDPCFAKAFQALREALLQSPLALCPGITWLL
jgi:DNA-binding transcriptional LysR family regulator